LYNWKTAKKVCPDGWHLPTDEEWKELERHLEMKVNESDKDGWRGTGSGKLKETGFMHWDSPNEGATNESGFTALPGGYRSYRGWFGHIGHYGRWWSSTECSSATAWYRGVASGFDSKVDRNSPFKTDGFSVRCVSD
jgi:uncharacterized protein (TIGR02145 family)